MGFFLLPCVVNLLFLIRVNNTNIIIITSVVILWLDMFYVAFLYNESKVQIKSKVAKVIPNLKLCTTQVCLCWNLWFWCKSFPAYASKSFAVRI